MPTPDGKINVFLSYARKDDYLASVAPHEEHTYHLDAARSFTRQLYNALTAAGFAVWWDREAMPNRGLTFLDEIKTAVTACDFLVYVAGAVAKTSPYVKAEWQYAKSLCKPIISLVRGADYSVIPAEIGMDHAPDLRDLRFFDAKVAELIRLLSDVHKLATLHSVPTLPEWYVERGHDVQDIQKAIRADAVSPVVVTTKEQTITLEGMGGLGKTTLATAVSRLCDVRATFPDGVFWVEIGKTPSIPARQGDIGVAFEDGRAEYPDEQRGKSRLSAILEQKAVLIVLDDVWDSRHVEAFRVNAPRSRILVTTRNGRMATELGVTQHTIDGLTEDEGVALIGKRLGRAPEAPNPDAEDERAIVRLLGGHTLAISIAAARISEEGIGYSAHFRARLETRRATGGNPLGDLKMNDKDKNFNLELSLAESYEVLTPQQQEQFRALGVFALSAGFDRAAAGAVWGMTDPFAVEDTLRFFTKASLLTESERERYELHGLLRDYARALSRADALDAHQRRHFDHYEALYGDANRNNDEDHHAQIDAAFPQIQTALSWGLDHAAERACDWVIALQHFMQLRRTSAERLSLLHETQAVSVTIGYQFGEANTLNALGDVHTRKSEFAEAVARYQEALPLYKATGVRWGEANTLLALGEVHRMKDEFAEAVARYHEALPLFQATSAWLGEANTLKALGDVHTRKSEFAEAVARYQEALPLYQVTGARLGEANTLRALGDVHYMRDEVAEAVARYQEALPLYKTTVDRQGEANTLLALGEVHRRKSEFPEAVARYQEALPLYKATVALLGEANTLRALGDVHLMKNEYPEAVACYQDALALGEQIGDFTARLNSLRGLADTLHAQGDQDNACRYARQCLALAASHEFFKDHPVTQNLRKTFASWGCSLG